jgi:hypothetical protein
MNRITTAITRHIATAAIRCGWAILRAAENHRARGEHLTTWAEHLAERRGCVDDVLATLTNEALGH